MSFQPEIEDLYQVSGNVEEKRPIIVREKKFPILIRTKAMHTKYF